MNHDQCASRNHQPQKHHQRGNQADTSTQKQAKELSAERKGWADTIEKASVELELLEAGDVDGFQQTLASATEQIERG